MSHAALAETTPDEVPRSARGHWRNAVAGLLAIAVMLGVSELLAAALPDGRSHVVAVGDEVIDATPGWLERAAISSLGTADKPVLIATILAVSILLGAALGIAAARRFAYGVVGIVLMAGVGTAAALADPQAEGLTPVFVGALSALAGIATLWILLGAALPEGAERGSSVTASPTDGGVVNRGRFLALSGGALAIASLGAVSGRWLAGRDTVEAIRETIRLPRPEHPAPAAPQGASLKIPGLTPLFTPNRDFYRIDTALVIPHVDPNDWTLEVKGRVDNPLKLTYAELMAMPQIEADVTLCCVSNEVGGGLIGNARWQGVPLHAVLERAGPHNDATQIVGRSVDGFTAGFPTRKAIDDDEAMIAVAMNGEPLPVKHGFPARLVVPGLYGYVSATKWLSALELYRLDEFNGYWIPRGWSKLGPIKTQSRIDVPLTSQVEAGRQTIAGVAWAQTRGIERVEVKVDDGPWQKATLADALDIDTWRQWYLRWDATSGDHTISVRATDADGDTQTAKQAPPTPTAPPGTTRSRSPSSDVHRNVTT